MKVKELTELIRCSCNILIASEDDFIVKKDVYLRSFDNTYDDYDVLYIKSTTEINIQEHFGHSVNVEPRIVLYIVQGDKYGQF